jgi:DNA-binding MarR family transcriptional regulator
MNPVFHQIFRHKNEARALEREALKALTSAELKQFRRLVEKLTPI